MSDTAKLIREHGVDGSIVRTWETPFDTPTWWSVEGVCTSGDRAGSAVSSRHIHDLREALAELARMRVEEADRYDVWHLIRYQPSLRLSVEPEHTADCGLLLHPALGCTCVPSSRDRTETR